MAFMNEPRRPENRPARNEPTRRRQRDQYDEFRESLAAPVPATYRSRELTSDGLQMRPVSRAERLIRGIGTLLAALLAIRFIANLIAGNAAGPFTNLARDLTGWLVSPFATIFNTTVPSGRGYIDVPALVAIVVVSVVAYVLGALTRGVSD
jgi:hypothetical protein